MSWQDFIKSEMQKDYFHNLDELLKEDEKKHTIYPPKDSVFRAFDLCSIENVRCLILGQDPYINPNEAMGLSFSVPSDTRIPPSLQNIFKEIQNDLGVKHEFKSGDLTKWAEQGVLLLNSSLTVRRGQSGSHSKYGWWLFTDAAITLLNSLDRPIVFMFWGNHAKSKVPLITNKNHLILTSGHPSPFSSHLFFGNKHFSKANEFLVKNNQQPISWTV